MWLNVFEDLTEFYICWNPAADTPKAKAPWYQLALWPQRMGVGAASATEGGPALPAQHQGQLRSTPSGRENENTLPHTAKASHKRADLASSSRMGTASPFHCLPEDSMAYRLQRINAQNRYFTRWLRKWTQKWRRKPSLTAECFVVSQGRLVNREKLLVPD